MPLCTPPLPSQRQLIAYALEVQRAHRATLLCLKQLWMPAPHGEAGRSFLQRYQHFVDCVGLSFDVEERLLRAVSHPSYYEHSLAHRQIAAELADIRRYLEARDAFSRLELRHRLDAVIIHLTVDGGIFKHIAEGALSQAY